MSIRFECVGCCKKIVVHDRFQGRNVRCPRCSIELIVPEKSKPGEKQLESLAPVSQSADKPKQSLNSISGSMPPSESSWIETLGEAETSVAAKPTKKQRSRSIQSDRDDEKAELEWDITPMVDVAFLLLIFFMLTASFSIQKAIRTALPQSEQPSSNAVQVQPEAIAESVIVQIDEFNAYTVVASDGQTSDASSKQELISILRDIRSESGDQLPRIVIQAHVDSFHGATVGCMDAAIEAEFTSFQLYAVDGFD